MAEQRNFIRVSYSLLVKLELGYVDEAIAMLQGKELPSTEPQEAGKKLHTYTERHIKKFGRLPDVLGGEAIAGTTEQFLQTTWQYADWDIELVGFVDHVGDNGKLIQDWKFGKTELSQYVHGKQHKLYKLLEPRGKHFIYRHYNPYNDQLKSAILRLSDKDIEEAKDWVEHYSMELVNHVLYMIGNKEHHAIYTKGKRRFEVYNNQHRDVAYF